MIVPNTVPRRSMDSLSTGELDWDEIYADLAPRVYNYFRYRLGPVADVEDLTSRTFEKAWRSRSHYRRDLAGFSTWLFKIAQNVGIDYLGSRRQTGFRRRSTGRAARRRRGFPPLFECVSTPGRRGR